MTEGTQLVGAYPSGWIWPEDDFDKIKGLIPFFDALAIFLPEHLVDRVIGSDPYLVQPLFEAGYLRNINPDDMLDENSSRQIQAMVAFYLKQESEYDRIQYEYLMAAMTRTTSHLESPRSPDSGLQ